MAKKIYVLDTSVCLSDSESIYNFGNNDVVLPLKVLQEIDKHKKRQDGVGTNARRIIRTLDSLREKKSLQVGVRIERGKGILRVVDHAVEELSVHLDPTIADHVIISSALAEKKHNPERKVIMVSRDINMRVICDSIGLLTEDYNEAKVIKNHSELYTGFTSVLVDDQFIDQFYDNVDVFLDEEDEICPNQYVMLVSNLNEKKTALCRYINDREPLLKISPVKDAIWGVRARNKEQAFSFDLLMDPEVSIVTLVGKAGSGKTLCAVAAGLKQILEGKKSKDPLYKKLVVSRPVQPMGKDIGFLPGTMQDKMAPWLAPIQDNLKFLMGDQTTLEMYMDKGVIEMEALTYIRGRSIANAIVGGGMQDNYAQVVNKESPMKEWLIDYVGEQHNPDNDEVTVGMIVETMVKEFPDFVFALAEENFLRGYEQAFTDMQSVTHQAMSKSQESENEE